MKSGVYRSRSLALQLPADQLCKRLVSLSNSEMSGLGRHERSGSECSFMVLKDIQTDDALETGRETDQTQDSEVRLSQSDRQLSKVLVERDQNASFLVSQFKDLLVARVECPIARADDIVSCRSQHRSSPASHAGIQQEFHG